jgi:hypothetical protein
VNKNDVLHVRAIAVALSWCHDFLSFVPGVSVPGWPDGLGGDDGLAEAAGSASSIRRQCDAFSLEIDTLICSSFSFFWLICAGDKHVSFANAQEYGCGLSSVNA